MKIKKMKPFTVTLVWLTAMGACPDQRCLFAKTFGPRVRVTEELILKHGQKFQMDWLVNKLCTYAGVAKYDHGIAESWTQYWTAWTQYWTDRRRSDGTFRYTKRGLQRVRINYDAMDKAARPIRRARDKRENELAIRVLRDYRRA